MYGWLQGQGVWGAAEQGGGIDGQSGNCPREVSEDIGHMLPATHRGMLPETPPHMFGLELGQMLPGVSRQGGEGGQEGREDANDSRPEGHMLLPMHTARLPLTGQLRVYPKGQGCMMADRQGCTELPQGGMKPVGISLPEGQLMAAVVHTGAVLLAGHMMGMLGGHICPGSG